MKNPRFYGASAALTVAILLSVSGLEAAEGRPILRQNPRSTLDSTPSDSLSSEDQPSQDEPSQWALGVGGTTWGSNISAIPISAWLDFNSWNSLQVALGLGDIQPFKLHTAATYRLTLDGDSREGFHAGLGSQFLLSVVGASAGFDLRLLPLFGFHGRLPGLNKIGLSVDFGPEWTISDSGTVEFSVTGISPAMGLSAHYFF